MTPLEIIALVFFVGGVLFGTLCYLAPVMTRPPVLCNMAPPVSLDALFEEIAQRGGVRIRLQRRRSERALRLAVKRWPPQPEAFAYADLRESLANKVTEDYRASLAGMLPQFLTLLIALIVELLIKWWLEDRHPRNQQLGLLRDSLT